MLKAVTRQAAAVDAKIKALNATRPADHPISTANFFDHYATPEDIAVMVTEKDFLDANRELIPSVSAGELSHYEHVRATFEGAAKDKDKKKQSLASLESDTFDSSYRPSSKSGNGKGKGKAVVAGKGKGKAIAMTSSDEEDENYDDDAGADADRYASFGSLNGRARDKGKGKAVAQFQNPSASDDEGLY